MVDIIDSAVDFAKKIQTTKEYLNLQKAKKNNDEDVELNDMILKYNELTKHLKQLVADKQNEKEQINEQQIKISELYKKIMANKNMINFNKASDEVNILMNKINSILVDAVNGENVDYFHKNEVFDCGSCGKCFGKK